MIKAPTETALGGYFSLEYGKGQGLPLLEIATGYQSARAAMAAALESTKPKTVWVPYYICEAVNEMLSSIGVQTQSYTLSDELSVPNNLALEEADCLICVDYFGISGAACDAAIYRYGSERILVDASQSLFHAPRQGVATAYSARKFVGVPDGGLLVTPQPIASPSIANEAASINRSQHLLTRASQQVAEGYTQFQHAESTLSDCEPQAMTILTTGILTSIDFNQVRDRRIANYQQLAIELGSDGFSVPTLPGGAVPLCCPVLNIEASQFRKGLVSRSIFTPTYWPNTIVPENDPIGLALRDRTLYLPCDQRYGSTEMARIVQSLVEIRGSQ